MVDFSHLFPSLSRICSFTFASHFSLISTMTFCH
uniref:Uncharacterized protein n=1 Tax=Rhizophora mucronata TaxID=61149 RepID=A0A2P2J6L8_RHIMU